jgi:hypothetical protein
VGEVVVDGGLGVVVVVVVGPLPVVPVPPVGGEVVVVVADPLPVVPVLVAVVVVAGAVVVVVVVGGATKGTVSPARDATLREGAAARLVQLRAWFQFATAAVAGEPVRGWGRPARIVAGRNVASVMWRPTAVRTSAPLDVSGAVSS